ncbi:15670_t:CDS:2, partial [Funneliformis geosporum]
TFTRYKQQYLEELNYTYLYIGTANTVNDALRNLIFSIRYNIGFDESPVVVRQNIYNTFILIRGFALDPLNILYQISETTSISPSVTSDDTGSIISSDIFNNQLSNNILPFGSKPSNDNEASNEPTGSKEIDTAENEEDDILAINKTHQTTIKNNN